MGRIFECSTASKPCKCSNQHQNIRTFAHYAIRIIMYINWFFTNMVFLVLICCISIMGEPSSSSNCSGKTSVKKDRSDVWAYYEKIKDAPKARCTICDKELSYRGGTTNLRVHLTSKHSLLYAHEAKSKSKQICLDSYTKQQQYTETRANAITDRIVCMIALDLKPIRMVEGEGFLELLHYLEPGYKVPCRKFITKMVRKKHELIKEKLQSKLDKEATSVSLTTDI